MAYTPTVYVNNTTPAISAANLNKSETELEYLDKTTSQLANTSFGSMKADYGKNLFNKNSVNIQDEAYIDSSGNISANANYAVSDYIPVEATQKYTFYRFPYSNSIYANVYNKNLDVIETFSESTHTMPANACFVKFSIRKSVIDTTQVEKGASFTGYANYTDKKQTEDNTSDIISQNNKISILGDANQGFNLCDNTDNASGYIDYQTGNVSTHQTYYHTDYLPVVKDMYYGIAGGVRSADFAMYDKNKAYISNTVNSFTSVLGTSVINGWNVFKANFDGYLRFSLTNSSSVCKFLISDSTSWFSSHGSSPTFDYSNEDILPHGLAEVRTNLEKTTETANEVRDLFSYTNLADEDSFVENYFAYTNSVGGTLILLANNDYFYTNKIPVKEGDVVSFTRARAWTILNDSDVVVSYFNDQSETTSPVTVPAGASYMIISVKKTYENNFMVNYGSTLLPYVEHFLVIDEKCIETYLPDDLDEIYGNAKIGYSHCGGGSLIERFSSLSANTVKTIADFPKNLKKGVSFSFYAKFSSFTDVTFGKGRNDYRGDALKIDDTNIYWIHYNDSSQAETKETKAHGLTITNFLSAIAYVDSACVCHFVLVTEEGNYASTFQWGYEMNGIPFVIGSQSMTDVSFGVIANDIQCPVWLFGDSYFGANADRIVGQLKNLGFADGCLISGLAGATSNNALDNLQALIGLGGIPKILVWCLGMNDNGTNYPTILSTLTELSETYGFTLILYRVPTVAVRAAYNNAVNAIVEDSGLRYVDAKLAVGASDLGVWNEGYLSQDGVHPSTLGALAIASRMLVDVPEIMQYGYEVYSIGGGTTGDR